MRDKEHHAAHEANTQRTDREGSYMLSIVKYLRSLRYDDGTAYTSNGSISHNLVVPVIYANSDEYRAPGEELTLIKGRFKRRFNDHMASRVSCAMELMRKISDIFRFKVTKPNHRNRQALLEIVHYKAVGPKRHEHSLIAEAHLA
jgi:hypothetical protein